MTDDITRPTRRIFEIDEKTLREAKSLGINLSQAARNGVLTEIEKQKKIRALLEGA